MAVHDGDIYSHLRIKNFRQSYFFAEFMARHDAFKNCEFNVNDIVDCQYQMAGFIAQEFPNNITMQKQFLQHMKTAFETELLNDEDMKWIKTDDRACCFVWGVIRMANDDYLILENDNQKPNYAHHYTRVRLPLNTTSTLERYNTIVRFFDSLDTNIDHRRQLLTRISNDWADIYNSDIKAFDWLDKNNKEQCSWTWKYINSYKFRSGTKYIPRLFNPINDAEEHLFIFATWDLWLWNRSFISGSDIELFLIKISKAQSQRKHREKAAEKGVILVSTSLHKSTKNKLDELARLQGKKINELLTNLINAEYERSK